MIFVDVRMGGEVVVLPMGLEVPQSSVILVEAGVSYFSSSDGGPTPQETERASHLAALQRSAKPEITLDVLVDAALQTYTKTYKGASLEAAMDWFGLVFPEGAKGSLSGVRFSKGEPDAR